MNVWLLAATVLLVGLVPCGVVCLRSPRVDAVIALELGGTITTLDLLLLAEGFARPSYFELPLVFVVLAFVGSLVFIRLMERSL